MTEYSRQETLNRYYGNSGKGIRQLTDKLLYKNGIYESDKDEYYSLANEIFCKALNTYKDDRASFDTYLYLCLDRAIKTELSRQTASKRKHTAFTQLDDVEVEYRQDFTAVQTFFFIGEQTPIAQQTIVLLLQGYSKTEIRQALRQSQRQQDKIINGLKAQLTI